MPDDLPAAVQPLPFAQVRQIVELLCLELAAPGDEPIPPLVSEFLRQLDDLNADAAARVSLMLAAGSLRAADLSSHPLRAQAGIALVQAQALCPTIGPSALTGTEAIEASTNGAWLPGESVPGMDQALDFLIDAIEPRGEDARGQYLRELVRLCARVHGRLTDPEHARECAAAMLLQAAAAVMASR